MNTEEVRAWFEWVLQDTNKIYGSLHWKEAPGYGNVVETMNAILDLGNQILPTLPKLQMWVDSYDTNHIWIERGFKQGCESVKEYKTWGAYFLPKPPILNPMKDWSRIEQAYTGSFDIRYKEAVEAAYTVAVKSRTVPYSHEGECTGGFLCFLCEDLEEKWHKECLKEADMPNNPFWNEKLQTQCLNELKDIVVAPDGWVYQASTEKEPRDYKEQSTPFQRAIELSYKLLDWKFYYYKHTTTFDMFEWLSENLPAMEQRIRSDMDRAEDILSMF